jgi:hypothetical protein
MQNIGMRCDIYVDESSQNCHRYLLLGGVIMATGEASAFDACAIEARSLDLPQGEMGWVKVSRTKLPAYKRFVEAFFRKNGLALLDFHSIVVDTRQLDDRQYNGGSREAGFNKEIYQLIQKFGRLYRNHEFDVYLDERSTPIDPEELRTIVNHGMRLRTGSREWPVRRLHFRKGADCHGIQIVDVLLGAVAFHLNGHRMKRDASAAKCELSDYVLYLAKVADVRRDTALTGRFTIWHRQLRPRRPAR